MPDSDLHVSPAGRALIERNEGCRLTAYYDSVGVLTIGYGCTGRGIHEGMRVTQSEADQMLSDRLAHEFEPAVRHAIAGAVTSQAQFDAMVSLAFNIGAAGFATSSIARDHRAGDWRKAAADFAKWNHAGGRVLAGLTRRRAEEAQLYLSQLPQTGAAAPQQAPEAVAAAAPAAPAVHPTPAPPPAAARGDADEAAAEALNQGELDRLGGAGR